MSKVIVKISFKHPNKKSTKGSNVAHIKYIATRPGVDKSLTESDLQKELSEQSPLSDSDYVKYINERPNSHGLFDDKGKANFEDIKSEISQHDGYVWRMIVSLREDDANRLGYDNKTKWQDLLRMKMPDVAYKMGIKLNNLRWVAAIHMEKGHPHAHVIVWESKPEATTGIISKKIISDIRKIYIDEIFHEEKMIYMQEKTAMRDLIRDFAKNDMGQIASLIKEVRETSNEVKIITSEFNTSMPPRLYPEAENALVEKMNNLISVLPGHGRAYLKFMPEDVKDEIRKFADYVLSLDQYKPSVAKYLNAVKSNFLLYNSDSNILNNVMDRAYNDLRDRVCQVILKAAVDISIYQNKMRSTYLYDNYNSYTNIWHLWKSIWNTVESIRMREELTAMHNKKTIARMSALESKAARKEVAKKLSHSGFEFKKENDAKEI